METLFFHPKLVHVPIALGVLMPLVAAGVLVAWWRGWLPHRAWLLALGLQAVLVGSGLLALESGEQEEERVEAVVAERFIEAHEEAAQRFVWASAAVLALMAVAAVAGRREAARPLAAAATVGTLVVLVLGYETGEAGGSLVYDHGAALAHAGAPRSGGALALPGPSSHGDDDDDDD